MQCCCAAPRERQPAAAAPAGSRPPAALVLYEGVPPVSPSRRGGGGAERARDAAVPRHGVRLGYLSELAQQAEALPFPLTAVEADGTPRVVPSYEAFTCRDLCEFVVLPMTQSAGADGGSCSACELLRQGSRQSVHGATRGVRGALCNECTGSGGGALCDWLWPVPGRAHQRGEAVGSGRVEGRATRDQRSDGGLVPRGR